MGSRVLFQECIDNKTPWDFFVMDVILHRIRYNGNKGNLGLGECYIGLRELGELVGKDHKSVSRSLKRLEMMRLIRASYEPHKGTKITVLLHSMYSRPDHTEAPVKTQLRELNIHNNTKQENICVAASAESAFHSVIKNKYPKRKGTTSWAEGFARLKPQLKTASALESFYKAVDNYKAQCDQNQVSGTQYVKTFKSFCAKGVWEEFIDIEVAPAGPERY